MTPTIQNNVRVSAPRPLLRLASEIFDTPVAIIPEKLETILSVVGHRLVADEAALRQLVEVGLLRQSSQSVVHPYAWDDDENDDPYANSNDKPYKLTSDGIAIIPISGTLMESGGWMSALSGCSSYNGITKAVKTAMDKDSAVKAVLFNISSPGGSTHGCFECCDLIHSYRGKKPMYAIAKHMACSAAYALGSSADKFFVTLTGAYGSIGVFALHYDISGADSQAGVKYTYIHYGAKKVDGNPHEPLGKSAKSDIQTEVDREGDLFVSRVARNRKTTDKLIADTQAGVFYADGSIPLLADEVATYDEVLAKLSGKVKQSSGRMFSTGTTSAIEASAETHAQNGEGNMAKTLSVEAKAKLADAQARKKLADDEIAALSATDSDPNSDNTEDCDPEMKKKKAVADAAALLTAVSVPALASAIPISAPASASSAPLPYPAAEVAELCKLSGFAADAPDFILASTPLAEVRKTLLARRAENDSNNRVSSGFGTVSTDALDTLQKQATTIAANSNGTISAAKAFEMALRNNPAAYAEYNNERAVAALTPKGRDKYVTLVAARMPMLGLSAEFGVR